MANFANTGAVDTSTLEHIQAKSIDIVLSASPATLLILGNQKPWKGKRYKVPVRYQNASQGIDFDGLDKFSTTKVDKFINAVFDPTGHEEPVVISQMESDVNAADPVVDFIKREMQSAAIEMADSVATKFYTAQTGKAFLSIIDAVDDGTNVATYAGLSRTTYTGWAGNYTASVGTMTLSTLRTMMNSCTHGMKSPNILITDRTTWGYYEALLTPTVRNQYASTGYPQMSRTGVLPGVQALQGQQGFDAIYYSGKPVVADEKCTSGNIYFLNTEYLYFAGLKSTDPRYKSISFGGETVDSVYNAPVVTGFNFSGFDRPIDQYGQVGHIILMGNLICESPRHQGRLLGITGS